MNAFKGKYHHAVPYELSMSKLTYKLFTDEFEYQLSGEGGEKISAGSKVKLKPHSS